MVGQPYNPDNCAFLSSQSLNANQFNPNVPYSTNNTTHLILWDFVEKKILWVNSQTNLIESEIGGSDIVLPTNVGNLVVNESGSVQSTLVREYTIGETNIFPIQTHTGTTQETIIKTIYVPANTYKIGDYFDQKPGMAFFNFVFDTSNPSIFRIYYNNSPSLVGATSTDFTTQNGQGRSGLSLNFGTGEFDIISNNTIRGGNIDSSSNPFVYNVISQTIFDITQDAYFILTAELSSVSDRAAVETAYLVKAINAQKLVP